jgi:hypothetical protein
MTDKEQEKNLATIRWKASNTGDNARALVAAINDPTIVRVTLFATLITPESTFSFETDGPETNLPLLAALSESRTGDVIVYDGRFLTAARRPRYLEVRAVLDAAASSGKVEFCASRVPFTSGLDPDDAARTLRCAEPGKLFTTTSRREFFALLSALSEREYAYL